MNTDHIEHSKTVRLPMGTRATFQVDGDGLHVSWSPSTPKVRAGRQLNRFLKKYFKERDAFLEEVAAMSGGDVLVETFWPEIQSTVIRAPERH